MTLVSIRVGRFHFGGGRSRRRRSLLALLFFRSVCQLPVRGPVAAEPSECRARNVPRDARSLRPWLEPRPLLRDPRLPLRLRDAFATRVREGRKLALPPYAQEMQAAGPRREASPSILHHAG
eukprot:218701-Pleurochrysis_carterae.AAC.3